MNFEDWWATEMAQIAPSEDFKRVGQRAWEAGFREARIPGWDGGPEEFVSIKDAIDHLMPAEQCQEFLKVTKTFLEESPAFDDYEICISQNCVSITIYDEYQNFHCDINRGTPPATAQVQGHTEDLGPTELLSLMREWAVDVSKLEELYNKWEM